MPEAKTDYNPDGYNRASYANIMQFIFADLMIRYDREGPESFMETNKEVAALRQRIAKVYNKTKGVPIQRIGEAVLLWLREDDMTVEKVLNSTNQKFIKRAKKLQG
jgi:hypothetical protein